MALKYKAWIGDVQRMRGTNETRLDKLRLDKNEKVGAFADQFWKQLISKIDQQHILAYPEVEPFYEKLAAFVGVSTQNLLVTAGSDFAIKIAFEAFVNPGDDVVVLDPTFAMVDVYCGLYRAKRIAIGYNSQLSLDVDRLMDSLNDKVSLVVLANPNSPTGTYITNTALSVILDRASQLSIPVLVDEAYFGFCPYSAIDHSKSYDNLVISRTFSKAAGLAGLRIGYLVSHPQTAQLLYRFRPMYEVNSIALLFASELLDHWEIVEEHVRSVMAGKEYLLRELNRLSFHTYDTMTNFIHVDFARHAARVIAGFQRDGILVGRGLSLPGFENSVRITSGAPDRMTEVIESISRSLA